MVTSNSNANYKDIGASTAGIFFFGTPHKGAQMLDSKKRVALLERVAKVITSDAIPPNLRSVLEPASNELFGVNDDFAGIKGDVLIVNFYEAIKTPLLSGVVSYSVSNPFTR